MSVHRFNTMRFSFVFPAVSLACAIATGVMWHRSYRAPTGDQVTWRTGSERYTLCSKFGRVDLRRPRGAQLSSQARQWVLQISNADVCWRGFAWANSPNDSALHRAQPLPSGTVGATADVEIQLTRQPRDVAVRVMLEALEYPGRFSAAHYWLWNSGYSNGGAHFGSPNTDPMVSTVFGLRAEMPALPVLTPRELYAKYSEHDPSERQAVRVDFRPDQVWVDPAQLPAIRRLWHDRFDITVYSIPWWPFLPVFSIAPALWLARKVRRSRLAARRLAGCCLNCGYDLRASTGRCPECGQPISTPTQDPDKRGERKKTE